MKKRKLLYNKIAEINKNLLEAQRILAYCTVTNQHYEMFETVSKCFHLKHLSPFLNKEYITFALSIKLQNFLNLKSNKFSLPNLSFFLTATLTDLFVKFTNLFEIFISSKEYTMLGL